MADLRLVEFVLLRANFEIRIATEWPPSEDAANGSAYYPAEDLLELIAHADRTGDEFVLRFDATLVDERLPFELTIRAGARFAVLDEPELTAERAESTLVFMAFPYLRESIWNLTGRSPYPPYALPPLTRLPDAPVRGDTPEIIRRPPPEPLNDDEPELAPPTEEAPNRSEPA